MRRALMLLGVAFTAIVVGASPVLEKRQIPGFLGPRPPQASAVEQQQQQVQALARLNAQQISDNVYRVQPMDQTTSTYGTALIILMPRGQTAATVGKDIAQIGQAIPGLMSQAQGQPTVQSISPVTTSPQNTQPQPQTSLQYPNSGQAVATYSSNGGKSSPDPKAASAQKPLTQSDKGSTAAQLAGGLPGSGGSYADASTTSTNMTLPAAEMNEVQDKAAGSDMKSNPPATASAKAPGNKATANPIAEGESSRGASQVSHALTAAATFR